MEVLKVKTIIGDLIKCRRGEVGFADFEFEDENDGADYKHYIDAFAQAGDGVLEVDSATAGC